MGLEMAPSSKKREETPKQYRTKTGPVYADRAHQHHLAETLERSVDCDVVGLQGHSLMHVCTLKAQAWPACHRSPKQRLAAAPHAIAL
jgi:hypothetical protein